MAEPSDLSRVRAERHLLRAAFAAAPVPLLLLAPDGTVRRANERALSLLGFRSGYATGRRLTSLVEHGSRAAVARALAEVLASGEPARVRCQLLSEHGPVSQVAEIAVAGAPGGPDQSLVVSLTPGRAATGQVTPAGAAGSGTRAVRGRGRAAGARAAGTGPGGVPGAEAADERARGQSTAAAVAAMAHRQDLLTATTELLLGNVTEPEPVLLQRHARQLAGALNAWVIMDLWSRGRLRRQLVTGPPDSQAGVSSRATLADPPPGSLPARVFSGGSVLLAHAEDAALLGTDAAGEPLLPLLGVTSVVCVPIAADGESGCGVLTLAREASGPTLAIADLGQAETFGRALALAVRAQRGYRRHHDVASALQASLLPASLPEVPGVELAAVHAAATAHAEVGGDFYDAYPARDGCGIAIGDVCGRGENAAAVTAAARYALRVLARQCDDPAGVLRLANEVMLAERFGSRFVTAHVAWLVPGHDGVRAVIGSAGHPPPLLVRADGWVSAVGGGGLPLGIFPDAEPAAAELTLAPRDVLFWYTDGVSDARADGGGYFEERLADELATLAGRPAAEITAAMRDRVLAASGGQLRDDLSILVVRAPG